MTMRRICIFFLTVLLAVGAGWAVSAAENAAVSNKELQRIKREMREKKKAIRRADRKERSILTDLDRIDREVQTGTFELAAQQKQLREAETSLRDLEKSSAQVSRELSGLRRVYGLRLRALYKMSRNRNAAAVLASYGRDGDPFKRMTYLGMIAERDRLLISEYGEALTSLSLRQNEIADRKQSLFEKKRAIEQKKAELEARKQKKARLLASIREEKGVYEQTLHELEESSAALWTMIRKAEQERTTAKQAAPAVQPPVRTVRQNQDHGMPWPVKGQVLTRFGVQQHPQFKTMVFRRGIEIAAHEGEPVRSVSDGQVVFADWYKGYGRLMIIEHAPGFYTLYGNLSRLDFKAGDRVLNGQVIGLAGDTGSLKGSKLYFEVRRNGEAQDPLLWLAKR